jgi:hypothetical protein
MEICSAYTLFPAKGCPAYRSSPVRGFVNRNAWCTNYVLPKFPQLWKIADMGNLCLQNYKRLWACAISNSLIYVAEGDHPPSPSIGIQWCTMTDGGMGGKGRV